MYKIYFSFFLLSLLSACATNPMVEYQNTIQHQADSAATSVAAAVKRENPVMLSKGEYYEFTLGQTNSVIKLNKLSYYEVFQFTHDGKQKCDITVKSFVKGMSPYYSILPVVAIVSPSGKVSTSPPETLEGEIPAFGPYRLTGKWANNCKEKGNYRVLVTADARTLNKPIDQQTMDLYIAQTGGSWTHLYTFFGHFTGDLSIEIN